MTLLTTYAFAIQLSTYALALINNSSSRSVSWFIVTIACFHVILISLLWPGSLLHAAETSVQEIKIYLKTEDNRRGTTTMAAIRTRGLERLDEICHDLHDLIAIQRVDFCISRAHTYVCGARKLCKKSRRCKNDIDALYEKLRKEIYYLDCPHRAIGLEVDLCRASDVERGAAAGLLLSVGRTESGRTLRGY
ncbi:hypothetical protein BDZ89DRAFT_1074738 [Hymenopellis radicata]|nr:hypothetical protein BDZ89DRAFT_1074738 [Hymenopellis radicata]